MHDDAKRDLMSQLYSDINDDLTAHIARTDESFRARYAGQPAIEIVDAAEHAFADLGMHLSDEQLEAYADSVEHRRPFIFVLG